MAKYPFIKQDDIKDCGCASLAMIIKYYKGYISLANLRELTKTNKSGTTAYHIIKAAELLGFKASGVKSNIDNSDIILPCIAHVTINNSYKHYVVIYEIKRKEKRIVIADPAIGIKKISFNEFEKIWDKVLIILYPVRSLPLQTEESLNKFIIKIIKPHKNLFLKVFVLSLFVTLFSCLSSLYFKNIIDNTSTSHNYIILIFIIFLFINILKMITDYFRNKLMIYINQKIDMQLTTDTFKTIIELPYQYYRNRTTGEVISRINDLNTVKSMINELTLTLFMDLPLSIISWVMLLYINNTLSLIALLMMLLNVFVITIFKDSVNRKINMIQETKAEATSYMVEAISGFESVKGLNVKDNIIDNFNDKYYRLLNHSVCYSSIINIQKFFIDLINTTGILVIVLIGGIKIMDKVLTAGSFIMFYNLLLYFMDPINNILNLTVDYKETKNALRRILDLFIKHNEKGFINRLQNSDICFKRVKYLYQDRDLVIDNIYLDIKEGEKVMLTGASGSGKSTLLKLLMKYYESNNNQIFINNIDINNYSDSAIHNNIIYISQDETIFTDSIINNLTLGSKIAQEKIIEISNMCEIDNIINKRNMTYHSLLEENGFNLSGGERQRIVLARAFLKRFKILLIDEGLNQMDVSLERRILEKAFNKYQDETIIVVSHRLENMDLYDKYIVLDKGKIIKEVNNA